MVGTLQQPIARGLDVAAQARQIDADQAPLPLADLTGDEHVLDVTGVHHCDHGAGNVIHGEHVNAIGGEQNNISFLAGRERADFVIQVGHLSAFYGGELDGVAAGEQTGNILLARDRTLVDQGTLQRERRAHDGEHVGGHIAFDIHAEAGANAVVERGLEGRHAVAHLHFNRGGNGDFTAAIANHLPHVLVELRAVDVLVVRAHQPVSPHALEGARTVADDVRGNGHSQRARQFPMLRVGSSIECESQQLVIGREILGLDARDVLRKLRALDAGRIRIYGAASGFLETGDARVGMRRRVRDLSRGQRWS